MVTSFEGKVKLVKINTQEHHKSAEQLGVRSIPAIYAFKNGIPIDGFTGLQDDKALIGFIERLFDE